MRPRFPPSRCHPIQIEGTVSSGPTEKSLKGTLTPTGSFSLPVNLTTLLPYGPSGSPGSRHGEGPGTIPSPLVPSGWKSKDVPSWVRSADENRILLRRKPSRSGASAVLGRGVGPGSLLRPRRGRSVKTILTFRDVGCRYGRTDDPADDRGDRVPTQGLHPF